nr:hypothetical protein [Streptomyces tsukubensis NRRL18488]
PATTVLPLLALLLALVTTAFGGSVLAGVEDARDRAAVLSVGADARVESAGALPKGVAEAVRKVPGVTGVVEVYRETDLSLRDGDDARGVTLLAVEPGAYARLARSTGLGGFPADALRKPESGPLPVVVSPGAAERLGSGPRTIGPLSAALTVRVAAVRELTPGLSDGDFVLVDAAALTGPKGATTLLVSGGSVAGGPLRAAVGGADGSGEARVALRSEERAAFAESPVADRGRAGLRGRGGRGGRIRGAGAAAVAAPGRSGADRAAGPAAHDGPDPASGPETAGAGESAGIGTGGSRGRPGGVGCGAGALPRSGPAQTGTCLGRYDAVPGAGGADRRRLEPAAAGGGRGGARCGGGRGPGLADHPA